MVNRNLTNIGKDRIGNISGQFSETYLWDVLVSERSCDIKIVLICSGILPNSYKSNNDNIV